MNILLIGYGKMGKILEELAINRHHNITHIIDNDYHWETLKGKDIDVAIDFSIPMLADYNIEECFNRDIPIVVGTTGWYNKLPQLKARAIQEQKGLFVASNYSIGMFIFNKINAQLASLMNNQPSYDVTINEIHHTQKLDAPSGTAITLAETIIDNVDRLKKWHCIEENDDIFEGGEDILTITSQRIGEVPGTHTITYSSEVDDISITHEAHNRKGFALGAILAAEFLKGKRGFYSMQDIIK